MRDVAENGSLARFPLLLSSHRGSYIFNNSTPYLDQKKRKIFPSRNSFLLESCHEVQCEMDQSWLTHGTDVAQSDVGFVFVACCCWLSRFACVLGNSFFFIFQVQIRLYYFLSVEFVTSAKIFTKLRRISAVLQILHTLKYYYWIANPRDRSGVIPKTPGNQEKGQGTDCWGEANTSFSSTMTACCWLDRRLQCLLFVFYLTLLTSGSSSSTHAKCNSGSQFVCLWERLRLPYLVLASICFSLSNFRKGPSLFLACQ